MTAERRPAGSVLALVGFAALLPLIGGQLGNDASTLEPGVGATIRSLLRGTEVGPLQHGVLALIICGLLIVLLVRRRVIQFPHASVMGPLAALLGLLMASVLVSNHRWQSQTSFAEWIVYGVTLLATVAGVGRKQGPLLVLSGLAAGCGIAALLGLAEYGAAKAQDPTWRIFGGWHNPNAFAGMMLIGLIVSAGLLTIARTSAMKMLALLGAVANGLALVLTGSKGGFLAAGVGSLVLIVMVLWWGSKSRTTAAVSVLAVLLLVGAGAFALNRSAAGSAGDGANLRVLGSAGTQEQSAGFRLQLYKGAVQLVKESPLGKGIGSYAFYSAKPGLTTRTELTHSTWLQLAVEAGFLAPVVLLVLIAFWLFQCLRRWKPMPTETNLMRATIIAAVLATLAHGVVESNLYFFGIGAALFLLLGLGLQLASDAVAPEYMVAPMRVAIISFAGVCAGQLLFSGFIGRAQAIVRYQLQTDPTQAIEGLASLRTWAGSDPETWYRSGLASTSIEQAVASLTKAAELSPSAKYYRSLARVYESAGDLTKAQEQLRKALSLDPNNLTALWQLMKLEEAIGQPQDAARTAARLIEVESTPYFKVRSLPEIVPTETFQARIYLAARTNDPKERVRLLRPAIEGLLDFAQRTVPFALNFERNNMMAAGAPGPNDRAALLESGTKASADLEAAYRALGRTEDAEFARKAAGEFVTAAGLK